LTIRAVGSALRFGGRMLPCPKIVELLAENGTSAKNPANGSGHFSLARIRDLHGATVGQQFPAVALISYRVGAVRRGLPKRTVRRKEPADP
jgi:hypothetical protein